MVWCVIYYDFDLVVREENDDDYGHESCQIQVIIIGCVLQWSMNIFLSRRRDSRGVGKEIMRRVRNTEL